MAQMLPAMTMLDAASAIMPKQPICVEAPASGITVLSRQPVRPDGPPSTIGDLTLSVSDLPMLSCHYIQKGLFFPAPDVPMASLVSLLVSTLSRALAIFPALAGRLVTLPDDRVVIRCNDAGVEFHHAVAPALSLDDFLVPNADVPTKLTKDLFPMDRTSGDTTSMTMTEEGSKNQIGEGGTSSAPATAIAPRSSVSLPSARKGTAIVRRPAPAPARPPTLGQAEEGHSTASKESVEQCRKAKVEKHLELGTIDFVFSLTVLCGLFCLPEEAKLLNNVPFQFSLLLAFATFLSGTTLVLLSLHMLERLKNLVSAGQRVVSKCLIVVCTVLPLMTLVSLLALLPSTLYMCLGLAVITADVLPVVAAYCYLWWRAEGGDEAAAYEEHKDELDTAAKITLCVTNSAFGGLVGVLFSASKSEQGFGAEAAVYAAIFFMFSTAILGMFVMTVSNKVPKVTKRPLRLFLVSAINLANALLLCSLACAAVTASFAVIGCKNFASFAPLAITGVIYLAQQHCAVRRGHADPRSQENEEARLKATEEIASKVAAATMGAIMAVLAGSLGEKRREKTVATDLFMAVLTSMFVSSFGFMLLAALPSSARLCFAPMSKLLVWSSVALFATAAISIYGAEVFRAASH